MGKGSSDVSWFKIIASESDETEITKKPREGCKQSQKRREALTLMLKTTVSRYFSNRNLHKPTEVAAIGPHL